MIPKSNLADGHASRPGSALGIAQRHGVGLQYVPGLHGVGIVQQLLHLLRHARVLKDPPVLFPVCCAGLDVKHQIQEIFIKVGA